MTLAKARAQSLRINYSSLVPPKSNTLGVVVFENFDISQILPFIDWKPFFDVWQLRGKYPNRGFPKIFKDKEVGGEAKKVFDEANVMIHTIISENQITAKGVIGIFPAYSEGDDIRVLNEDKTEVKGTLYGLRQQAEKIGDLDQPYLCMSDFIAPQTSGVDDYVGMFACSVGFGVEELCKSFLDKQDVYNEIMVKAIADR